MKSLYLSLLLLITTPAYAMQWIDLWKRKDQQGVSLLKAHKPKEAANIFSDPLWRGIAHYRSGNYKMALKTLNPLKTELAYYNKGNTLAHLGEYKAGIAAYDHALALNPNNKDAFKNRELLKELLKKQKKQQKNQQENTQNKREQPPSKQKQEQPQQQQASKEQESQPQEKKPASQKKITQSHQKQREKQQAKKQWIRRIPDDPGGLLRQKFLRDFLRMQTEAEQS